jgi:hypothetical protein
VRATDLGGSSPAQLQGPPAQRVAPRPGVMTATTGPAAGPGSTPPRSPRSGHGPPCSVAATGGAVFDQERVAYADQVDSAG